jgi:putative SOS response-associated peptidase YedK
MRPTDAAPIFRRRDDGVEMVKARWWLVPWWHKGALKEFKLATFNARSETVATSRTFRDSFKQRRCLVAAEGWHEWTGEKGKKTKWRFTPKDEAPICFAGIWDRCKTTDAGEIESFTIITQPAGSTLNAYHDRAPVVLQQRDWETWLDLDADPRPLLGQESIDHFDVAYVAGPKIPYCHETA